MSNKVQTQTAPETPTTTVNYGPPKLKLITVFVGGAADYDSFLMNGPTFIMGFRQFDYIKEVRGTFKNTIVEGRIYNPQTDEIATDPIDRIAIGPFKNKIRVIYCGYDQATKSVLEDIKKTIKEHGQEIGLIVVGHSLGGWQGSLLVEKLMAENIKEKQTDLLVTLDPVGERYFSPHRMIPGLNMLIPNLSEPNPIPKYWINTYTIGVAGTSDQTISDNAVATAGDRWDVTKANESTGSKTISHGNAKGLLNLKSSTGKSAMQKIMEVTTEYLK